MSLPTLFAGKSAPGLSAALDLRFALDKSLTAYRGPTPSFSRASTGSYFDGSGVLRYANVNIQPYSEQFSSWAFENSSVSSDVAVAPDGKTTADKVYETSATGEHNRNYNNTAAVGTYTLSFYIKPAGRNWAAIYIYHPSIGRGHRAWFDVQNGVVGTTAAIGAGLTGVSSGMVSAGNGWYRCWLTATTAATDLYSYIGLAQSNGGATNYAGDGSSGSFVWGAQLEASSTVGTYCPTTSSANSAPRFNHTFNGTSWVSRGLLVEEQRTNSSPYSVTFNSGNAPWGMADLSISLNSATAPDGTNTATKIIEGTGTGNHNIYRVFPFSGTITWSIFAKAAERNYIQIFIGNLNSPETGINVDLTNGTITNQSPSVVAAGTQDVGNGWYRIWFSVTGAGGTYYPAVSTSNSATGIRSSYTGNGTSGVYIWGAQWESGSFPTSYIGNSGSGSTARSADVCQITGTDFSGFWNGTEGSTAAEYDLIGVAGTGTFGMVFQVDDNTLNNRLVQIGYEAGTTPNNAAGIFVANGGVAQANMYQSSIGTNLTGKASFAYKANDFALSVNGASVSTDTSGSIPAVTQMNIGRRVSDGYLNGHIARLRYYRKRLPNETLQLLSEPAPTLNLQFALNKTLTPVAGPAPSFSRASTGTYFNASGVLTSASINTPRFDHVYSGGQWVSKGLLIEEQRTNGLLQSNGFGNSPWTIASSRGTVTQNAASPDGTSNAWTSECTVTSPGGFYLVQGGLSSPSATYTISFFAKKGNNGFVALEAGETSNDVYVFFDLTNGLSGNLSSVGGYTNISHGLSDCGNGWYRCRLTFTKSNANNLTAYIYPTCNAMGSLSCTSGQSNFIFGAQYETGSFATSYIPTASSSVTRSADVCQITGTSFNWMWNQGEGSVASEFDFLAAPADRVSPRVWYASDGAYTNGMWVQSGASDGFYVYQSGSSQAGLTATALGAGVSTKVSSAYKLNDFAASFNGASALTDTTGNVPTVNRMEIGFMSDISGRIINGHIAKLIYYPARLTNTKLQQLST